MEKETQIQDVIGRLKPEEASVLAWGFQNERLSKAQTERIVDMFTKTLHEFNVTVNNMNGIITAVSETSAYRWVVVIGTGYNFFAKQIQTTFDNEGNIVNSDEKAWDRYDSFVATLKSF